MRDRCECPRCGGEMIGGICEECGFPANAKRILASYFEYDDERVEKPKDIIEDIKF